TARGRAGGGDATGKPVKGDSRGAALLHGGPTQSPLGWCPDPTPASEKPSRGPRRGATGTTPTAMECDWADTLEGAAGYPVWEPTVFTKNRERLLRGAIARGFFERVLVQAQARQLLSAEHFTVDGTLIAAWASLKSLKAKSARPTLPLDDPGNPTVNFHGERRSNATHASTT